MNSYGGNKVTSDPGGIPIANVIGEGGAAAALARNPNEMTNLNDSPEGPFSSQLGFKGDGGIQGNANGGSAENGGPNFHFK